MTRIKHETDLSWINRLSENTKDVDFVILSKAKNLIITIGYTARFFGSSLGMTILGQLAQRPKNIFETHYIGV